MLENTDTCLFFLFCFFVCGFFLFLSHSLWVDSHPFTAMYPLRDTVAPGQVIWGQLQKGEV